MRILSKSQPNRNNTDGILVDRKRLHAVCEKEGEEIYTDYRKWVSGKKPNATLVLCKTKVGLGVGPDLISNDFPFVVMYTNEIDICYDLGMELWRKMKQKGILDRLRKKYPRFTFYLGNR